MANKSLNVFLYNKEARAIDIVYDLNIPDEQQKAYTVKTIFPDLVEGQLVILPTKNRSGFTVVKVVELGTEEKLDFDSSIEYVWVAGKFDRGYYDQLVKAEKQGEDVVRKADFRKRVRELADNLPDDVAQELERSGNLLYNPALQIENGNDDPEIKDGTPD
jgi:hypothetical protein